MSSTNIGCITGEVRRLAHGSARRELEFDAADRRKTLAGEFNQIPWTGYPSLAASRRIMRTSSSIDRLCSAARTSRLVFASSSGLRMVMLAISHPFHVQEAFGL